MQSVPSLLVVAALLGGCAVEGDPTIAREEEQILFGNGLSFNGLSFNGLSFNSFSLNGLSFNGLSFNGLIDNGLSFNGLSFNSLEDNGLSFNGATTSDLAIELFSYIYSCAIPAEQSLTIDIDGVSYTFEGGLGLAPEWGVDGGSCDAECQQWVSACLLARTNALGQRVEISMRGPHGALDVTASEAADFIVFEGAFYGNLFVESPQLYACAGPGTDLAELTARFCARADSDCPITVVSDCAAACDAAAADGAMLDCQDDAAALHTQVITVYLREPTAVCGDGVCGIGEDGVTCAADCEGQARTIGGLAQEGMTGGVATTPDGGLVTAGVVDANYDFVSVYFNELPAGAASTVFVRKQDAAGVLEWWAALDAEVASVTGVDVDELGGVYVTGWFRGSLTAGATTLTTTWTNGFIVKLDAGGAVAWAHALSSATDDVVVEQVAAVPGGGSAITGYFWRDLEIAGVTLQSDGANDIFVIVVNADGSVGWAERFGSRMGSQMGMALTVDAAGNVIVGGRFVDRIPMGGKTLTEVEAWDGFLIKFDTAGQVVWANIINNTEVVGGAETVLALGTDSLGNVYAAGTSDGAVAFGSQTAPQDHDGFVVKYSAAGDYLWSIAVTGDFTTEVSSLDVGDDGSAVIGGSTFSPANIDGKADIPAQSGFVAELSPAGEVGWVRAFEGNYGNRATGVRYRADGRVAVAGSYRGATRIDKQVLAPESAAEASLGGFVASFADPNGAGAPDSGDTTTAPPPGGDKKGGGGRPK